MQSPRKLTASDHARSGPWGSSARREERRERSVEVTSRISRRRSRLWTGEQSHLFPRGADRMRRIRLGGQTLCICLGVAPLGALSSSASSRVKFCQAMSRHLLDDFPNSFGFSMADPASRPTAAAVNLSPRSARAERDHSNIPSILIIRKNLNRLSLFARARLRLAARPLSPRRSHRSSKANAKWPCSLCCPTGSAWTGG